MFKKYYYVKYRFTTPSSSGTSWVVYSIWFFQSLVASINYSIDELNRKLGKGNTISIEEIKEI